jgi:hypothetical protein
MSRAGSAVRVTRRGRRTSEPRRIARKLAQVPPYTSVWCIAGRPSFPYLRSVRPAFYFSAVASRRTDELVENHCCFACGAGVVVAFRAGACVGADAGGSARERVCRCARVGRMAFRIVRPSPPRTTACSTWVTKVVLGTTFVTHAATSGASAPNHLLAHRPNRAPAHPLRAALSSADASRPKHQPAAARSSASVRSAGSGERRSTSSPVTGCVNARCSACRNWRCRP